MNKDIKCIFCDLDLTLLKGDKSLSKDNIAAIQRAQEANIDFVITTGRMPFLIKPITTALGFDGQPDKYAICANGAKIVCCNDDIIKEFGIDKWLIDILIEEATKYHVGLFASSNNKLHCFNKDAIIESGPEGHVKLNEMDSNELLNFVNENEIYKISLVSGDNNLLVKVKKEIDDLTNKCLSMSFCNSKTIEIVANNRTKGKAIKDFCEYMNIDINDTLAIGDNFNDITMMETVKYRACPANATLEIKQMCDYVAMADNENSAVAEIINCFIL